ncbi:MAG: Uncharacterised protein [Flavobacteriales bacterium UBA4585]|nr:MAG: Uncharacterised protein [Flavobacteriales bacterium UBA4585]
MLIIPAVPSGSYFALGFVITSIFSTLFPGKLCKSAVRSSPVKREGRPSIIIRTALDPRRVMFPSRSNSTDGMFSRMSVAEPVLLKISFEGSYTLRSISLVINWRSASTVTSSSSTPECCSPISPNACSTPSRPKRTSCVCVL